MDGPERGDFLACSLPVRADQVEMGALTVAILRAWGTSVAVATPNAPRPVNPESAAFANDPPNRDDRPPEADPEVCRVPGHSVVNQRGSG